jgi:hypothetical protein
MREACKFNVWIHNGNILMSSVTKNPGVSSITFQRQRHKLSAPTVGRMLDSDLIPDLRSKGVIKLFRKTQTKYRACYLELCTGRRSNCSTSDHMSWGGGGWGGTHKTKDRAFDTDLCQCRCRMSNFFEKPKSKIVTSTSTFWKVEGSKHQSCESTRQTFSSISGPRFS